MSRRRKKRKMRFHMSSWSGTWMQKIMLTSWLPIGVTDANRSYNHGQQRQREPQLCRSMIQQLLNESPHLSLLQHYPSSLSPLPSASFVCVCVFACVCPSLSCTTKFSWNLSNLRKECGLERYRKRAFSVHAIQES